MRLTSGESAIFSAVIYNALIIVALIPLALKGVKYGSFQRVRCWLTICWFTGWAVLSLRLRLSKS